MINLVIKIERRKLKFVFFNYHKNDIFSKFKVIKKSLEGEEGRKLVKPNATPDSINIKKLNK